MRPIDADILKDAFKDKEGNEFTAFHFYEAIEKTPTIDSLGSWIPVEERLPEEHGYYLVTTDGSHNSVIDIAEYGMFFRKQGCEYVLEWNKASKIIAWMPLPNPYEVKNNDT